MQVNTKEPMVTVLMPTYNQSAFMARAIRSLLLQTFTDWQLIIINDGSSDKTSEVAAEFVSNPKISYIENLTNCGLGYSLNRGIEQSNSEYIAYLPSDDVYYRDHLESLVKQLSRSESSIMTFSGVVFNGYPHRGVIDDHSLQLVQVLHKKIECKWLERTELVTDSLDIMYWKELLEFGDGTGTGKATCQWVSHPDQRHKIINDRRGGNLFKYKNFYKVRHPIKFHPVGCNFVDEEYNFRHFRNTHVFTGIKILLVGELAYNAERICALEERGHKLYALWIDQPENFNASGSLPFGNIETIEGDDWEAQINQIQPDIIYSLLNFQAIPLAHKVLKRKFNIPFIWHFKEGPFYAIQAGTWDKLIYLLSEADGVIYNNKILKDWFEMSIVKSKALTFILDGDLPVSRWFTNNFSSRISASDGEIHTVFAGRPLGVTLKLIEEVGREKIHMHFYGDIFNTSHQLLIKNAKKLVGRYIHTHSNCVAENWVKEFSQYDAGWLHNFKSKNHKELLKATWEDLNSPARLSTYACAGLPMIQFDNKEHIVHSYDLIQKANMGVAFKTGKDLASKLRNTKNMDAIRKSVINNQKLFCFDDQVDGLMQFFNDVINKRNGL